MADESKRRMTGQEEMEYEMRPKYDLSNARPNPYSVRAKARAAAGAGNIAVIEPELFEKFPSAKAVNEALRSILKQREQSAA